MGGRLTMLVLARMVLLTARRDRFLAALGLLFLLGAGSAAALGGGVLVEKLQTALALAAAGLRWLLALGMVVFVGFHVRRIADLRELELLLSRPLSRGRVVLGLYLGYAAVALVFAGLAAALVALAASGPGLIQWAASLAVEALAVTAAALFFALALRSAVAAVLASGAFYVLARLIGLFLGVAADPGADPVLARALNLLSVAVPRLDLQGQTAWLVHGPDASAWVATLQVAAFVPLILAAAVVDLRLRQREGRA